MIIVEAIKKIGERFFNKKFNKIREYVELEIAKNPKASYEYLEYLAKIGHFPIIKNIDKLEKSAVDYSGNKPKNPDQWVWQSIKRMEEKLDKQIFKENPIDKDQKDKEEEKKEEYRKKNIFVSEERYQEIFIKSKELASNIITQDIVEEYADKILMNIWETLIKDLVAEDEINVDKSVISPINEFANIDEVNFGNLSEKAIKKMRDENTRKNIINATLSHFFKFSNLFNSPRYFVSYLLRFHEEVFNEYKNNMAVFIDNIFNFDAFYRIVSYTPDYTSDDSFIGFFEPHERYEMAIKKFNKFIQQLKKYIYRDSFFKEINELGKSVIDVLDEEVIKLEKNKIEEIKNKIIYIMFIYESIKIFNEYSSYVLSEENIKKNIENKIKIMLKSVDIKQDLIDSEVIDRDFVFDGIYTYKTLMDISDKLNFFGRNSINHKNIFIKILMEYYILRFIDHNKVKEFVDAVLNNDHNRGKETDSIYIDNSTINMYIKRSFKENMFNAGYIISMFNYVYKLYISDYPLFLKKMFAHILNYIVTYSQNIKYKNFNLNEWFALNIEKNKPSLKGIIDNYERYLERAKRKKMFRYE